MDGIETAQRILQKQNLPLIYLTSNADSATFSMVRIFLKEILWLEADDYYSKLITKDREYLITQPLKQMGESLAERPEFMRIHRSFIVNLTQIEEIGDVFVTIHNRQIPLNKTSKLGQRAQTTSP